MDALGYHTIGLTTQELQAKRERNCYNKHSRCSKLADDLLIMLRPLRDAYSDL